jgi:TonB family protein
MSRPCRGNTQKLIALMSGSLSARAADKLRRHLEGCPGCSEAYARLTKTRELLGELGQEEPPDLSWRQIEAQIHWRLSHKTQAIPTQRAFRLPLALAAAAAAGALAAVALLWFVWPHWGLDKNQRAPGVSVAAPSAPDAELAALATVVQGEVTVVTPQGHEMPLELTRPVLARSRVVTAAGSVALQWAGASGLLLMERSNLELRRFAAKDQELHLHDGKVVVTLPKLGSDRRFAVVAKGIVARVKGTTYSVATREDTVEVEVFEGVVRVAPQDDRWGLDVPAGHGVSVPVDARRAPQLVRLGGPRPNPPHLLAWASLPEVLATTGLMRVSSQPSGADLVLDARPVGATDLALRGELGRHKLEVWRDGKLLETRWIELSVHQMTAELSVRGVEPTVRLPVRIHRFIRQRAVQIRACYERHLKRDPNLEGRLLFRINIDESGRVSQVSLLRNSFPDPRVGQCAQMVLERWQFPAGKAVQVVYPFVFRPQ